MTYAMVLIRADAEWESMSDAEREFDALVQWWTEGRAKGVIVDGVQLAAARTATTISFVDREPIVTDGPHVEAMESIGGICILDVGSQEEAVAIARTWPARRGIRIEVRNILPRRTEFNE